MTKTHITVQDVVREYGTTFDQITDSSVENTFFRTLKAFGCAHQTGASVVMGSINPVTPHHVFMIPSPQALDVSKDNAGQWRNMPEDSYLNDAPLSVRLPFAQDFGRWITSHHKDATGIDPARIKRSFMTANEGPESSRAVKWAHVHDLILLDEDDYHSPDIQALGDVDRFCRLPDRDPMEILAEADRANLEAQDRTEALQEKEAAFTMISTQHAWHGNRLSRDFLCHSLTKENDSPVFVRPGHTTITCHIPLENAFFPDRDNPSIPDLLERMEFLAGNLKNEFRNTGAAGFTVVMDTTPLRNPQIADRRSDISGRFPVTQHIIPHPEGVPFVKGGFVYALQNATAPALQK